MKIVILLIMLGSTAMVHADEKRRLAVVALEIDQMIVELKKIQRIADKKKPVRIRYRDNRTGQGIIDDLIRIQEGIQYAVNERIELDNRPNPMTNDYGQKQK